MTLYRRITLLFFFCLILLSGINAQGPAYIIALGPTLSTQKVGGFSRDPFLRYHGYVSIESTSDISPNALYARVGYHIKGSAVNSPDFYDQDGNQYEGSSSAMEFHNVSFSLGIKQRRELGTKFFHYGFGVRGDYNVKTKFGTLFAGLEGAQNKFTYGVDVDLGVELPLSELISTVFEIGISPDFAEQLFIPPQRTGYYVNGQEIIMPETRLTNVVIEARLGFRLWNKIIYTD